MVSVDSLALNYSVYPVHYANDTVDLYINGNDFLNTIDFYDIRKRRKIHSITFPKTGQRGALSTKKKCFMK